MLRSLAASLALMLADWGVWEWALANNHATISVIAGLAMAPLAVLIAWYTVVNGASALRFVVGRTATEVLTRNEAKAPVARITDPAREDMDEQERLAA